MTTVGSTRPSLARRWALRWIGPALFLGLWWTTDLSQVRHLLDRTRLWPLAAAAGLNIVLLFLKAWRWREIMKVQGIVYGYGRSLRAYTIACALAAWTPGRLGDFMKAVTVSREKAISFGRAASSVIADRLLDALALTLSAAAGAAILLGAVAATVTWCLVALAGVLGWILYRWIRVAGSERAGRALSKVGLGRAGRELGDAIAGLEEVSESTARAPAFVAVVATACATLLSFFQGYLIAFSLGLPVSFLRLSAGFAAASIASMLPLSVSGIGLREATLAFYLGPAGIPLGEVLTLSVAFLIVVNGSAALYGALANAFWPSPRVEPQLQESPAGLGAAEGAGHAR